MSKPGPPAKPVLRVVKTGNPGKKSKAELERQVVFTPAAPAEPDWNLWFPGRRANAVLLRRVARETWKSTVPVLDAHGVLAIVDALALTDLCVSTARLVELEQMLTEEGVAVEGERGVQKHPAVTAANQYRGHLRSLWVAFYMHPAARARAENGGGRGDEGDDDPFD